MSTCTKSCCPMPKFMIIGPTALELHQNSEVRNVWPAKLKVGNIWDLAKVRRRDVPGRLADSSRNNISTFGRFGSQWNSNKLTFTVKHKDQYNLADARRSNVLRRLADACQNYVSQFSHFGTIAKIMKIWQFAFCIDLEMKVKWYLKLLRLAKYYISQRTVISAIKQLCQPKDSYIRQQLNSYISHQAVMSAKGQLYQTTIKQLYQPTISYMSQQADFRPENS